MIALTGRHHFNHDDGVAALRVISRTAAATLGVERVSIWTYREDRTAIVCVDLFEATPARHSAGAVLESAATPNYFRALATAQIIVVDDALVNPHTAEFAEGYLRPLGITSMLDAPVIIDGRRVGVICHEQIGAPRVWTEDEQTFAVGIANLVALVLEGVERRHAEQAREQSLARFQMLSQATNDAVWDWDLLSNRLWWSNNFRGLFGYREDEIEPGIESWLTRIHPDDEAQVQASIEVALKGHEPTWHYEYRFRRRDGSYASVFDRGYILRNEQQRGIRMIGAMQDITERTLAEEALRRSEERYRQLFEFNPHPMWVYDLQTLQFLAANEAAVLHYGYSREEFLGMRISDIRPLDDVPLLLAALSEPVQVRDAGLWRHRRKDGTLLSVEMSAHRIEFEGRKAELVLAHDVTLRHEADEKMRAQLDELLRWQRVIVSRENRVHELKEEVNALLRRAGEPERYQKAVV